MVISGHDRTGIQSTYAEHQAAMAAEAALAQAAAEEEAAIEAGLARLEAASAHYAAKAQEGTRGRLLSCIVRPLITMHD